MTSAMWSPAAKANIALAMIEPQFLKGELWAEIYYEKELRHYSRVVRCTKRDTHLLNLGTPAFWSFGTSYWEGD